MQNIIQASQTSDIEKFLALAFPPEWDGIAARILETGATFSEGKCLWAPRWSKIPFTQKKGNSFEEAAYKSVIYRVHDCLHQLWGLPHPLDFTREEFYYYKRAQMCGEVAVLTLTEFVYAKYLYDTCNDSILKEFLWNRNALPLLEDPLKGKSILQIGMRLDDLLHKKSVPAWVRQNKYAINFIDDYVPMLESDRQQIDHNWEVMKENKWLPNDAPNVRYGRHLDGLELTIWMLEDFYHLQSTDGSEDRALIDFNRTRREKLILPKGWVS